MDQKDDELEGGAVPSCYSVPRAIQLLNTKLLTQKSTHSHDDAKNIHSPTFIICGKSDETISVEFGEHLEANISALGADHQLPSKHFQRLSDLTLDFVSGVEV